LQLVPTYFLPVLEIEQIGDLVFLPQPGISFFLSKLIKKWMQKCLLGSQPPFRTIFEHFAQQIIKLIAQMLPLQHLNIKKRTFYQDLAFILGNWYF